MEQDHNLLLKEAESLVPLGEYDHYKGTRYTVCGHAVYCSGPQLGAVIIYHKTDEPLGLKWVRSLGDFTANVDADTPRFRFYRKHNSAYVVLLETIGETKKIWDESKEANPGWISSGAGRSLQYLICDKISFCHNAGIIDRKEAELLLRQINKWC